MNIIRIEDCWESDWIALKTILYQNDRGDILRWDYVERAGGRQDSVIVIPRFKESGDLIMIREYRVIFDRYVIGFPAGLIAEGESAEACALRELKEETGYTGKVVCVSPLVTLHSALIKDLAYCVLVELEEGATPELQRLEPTEKIRVYRVKRDEINSFFEQARAKGDIIGGAPWMVLTAIKYL